MKERNRDNVFLKTFKYRLYPHTGVLTAFLITLEASRQLYNTALEHRVVSWKDRKKRINYYDQANELPSLGDPVFDLVHSQVKQDVLRRLQKAFDAFFQRQKNRSSSKGKTGFPRYKGKNRYHSFTYPQNTGFEIKETRPGHANLRLGALGTVKMRYHRPIPATGKVKTCTILRKNRKWYAVFSTELPKTPMLPGVRYTEPVGLENYLALSDGSIEENPRYYRKAQVSTAKEQKKLKRVKNGSNNFRKQSLKVAKRHEKVANQRADFLHKLTKKLVDKYPYIKVESLKIENMVRNHKLSKSIMDAGWGTFFYMLAYKAAEAGTLVEFVNPRGTSKVCWSCGKLVPKDLKDREHKCTFCGFTAHRDLNSALVIRDRKPLKARAGTARTSNQARGEPGDPEGKTLSGVTGSAKREASSFR